MQLTEAMFEFLTSVTKQHMVFVIKNLSASCFIKLFELLNYGIKSVNMKVMTDSASSLS